VVLAFVGEGYKAVSVLIPLYISINKSLPPYSPLHQTVSSRTSLQAHIHTKATMDFFKKGQDLLKKSSGSKPAEQKPAGEQDKQDYGDKGESIPFTLLIFFSVHFSSSHKPTDPRLTSCSHTAAGFIGKQTGHKMDPKTTEKVTDGARGLYEKFTGLVFPHHGRILSSLRRRGAMPRSLILRCIQQQS
jgi:hypothetical protein